MKRSIDKWYKTKKLLLDRNLRSYIPNTKRMNKKTLHSMLKQYGMVYVKPNTGSQGRGVIRVDRVNGRKGTSWKYQSGSSVHRFSSYRNAYRSLHKAADGKPYLIQKGIRMLRYRSRPFDFRIVVQKKPRSPWKVTGMAARLAHPAKIVTNGSQGGTIYSVSGLLSKKLKPRSVRRLTRQMEQMGLQTAARLHRTFPKLWEIGLDVAVDTSLHPWILEVNSKPDPCPFAQLNDPSMLREMIRYGKANGRTYKLHCKKSHKGGF
ncbi:YheC/YheD family protein [Paenibacillus protaetiae]|uniref:YheC/YheD family protein n=1 Tax=Paenibacillus protaetiae TaxID=2509456 RepID=A0A4P6EUA5_9BACL|nr:YheC/YheD family protein [Paenibacillus protaetiae]QAY65219.1 YheC/YheD family protein [Paenibacillus protaetiae]